MTNTMLKDEIKSLLLQEAINLRYATSYNESNEKILYITDHIQELAAELKQYQFNEILSGVQVAGY